MSQEPCGRLLRSVRAFPRYFGFQSYRVGVVLDVALKPGQKLWGCCFSGRPVALQGAGALCPTLINLQESRVLTDAHVPLWAAWRSN